MGVGGGGEGSSAGKGAGKLRRPRRPAAMANKGQSLGLERYNSEARLGHNYSHQSLERLILIQYRDVPNTTDTPKPNILFSDPSQTSHDQCYSKRTHFGRTQARSARPEPILTQSRAKLRPAMHWPNGCLRRLSPTPHPQPSGVNEVPGHGHRTPDRSPGALINIPRPTPGLMTYYRHTPTHRQTNAGDCSSAPQLKLKP